MNNSQIELIYENLQKLHDNTSCCAHFYAINIEWLQLNILLFVLTVLSSSKSLNAFKISSFESFSL